MKFLFVFSLPSGSVGSPEIYCRHLMQESMNICLFRTAQFSKLGLHERKLREKADLDEEKSVADNKADKVPSSQAGDPNDHAVQVSKEHTECAVFGSALRAGKGGVSVCRRERCGARVHDECMDEPCQLLEPITKVVGETPWDVNFRFKKCAEVHVHDASAASGSV